MAQDCNSFNARTATHGADAPNGRNNSMGENGAHGTILATISGKEG
jgi:hypothetical protein